jgi:DNA-binding NtrC family response regulator
MKQTFDLLVEHLIKGGFFLEEAVEILERSLIARAMERSAGNRSKAAKILGIHRNTLQRKLDAIEPDRKPSARVTGAARAAKAGRS